MKQKLILLTNTYPYGSGESFITAELPYALEHFQPVVLAAEDNLTGDPRPLPDGIEYGALFSRPLCRRDLILRAPLCLLRPEFYAELRRMKKRRLLTAANRHTLMETIIRGQGIMHELEKRYKPLLRQGDITLYAYWLRPAAYAAARLAEKYGCRAVSRCHGIDLYEERSGGYLPLRPYLLDKLSYVFPISRRGRDYLTRLYGRGDKIRRFYLGTQTPPDCSPARTGGMFTVVSCAYMSPVKRIPLLVQALSLLTEEVHWIHFGDGAERPAVEHACTELPDNIHWQLAGSVPHEKLLDYYRTHSVQLFVNTSESEGIPVSIMEAMSFAVPVLATDVGGTGELVHDGLSGMLVPADVTPEALAGKLRDFIRMGPGEYDRYRLSARSVWQENFCARTNYEKFYETLTQL